MPTETEGRVVDVFLADENGQRLEIVSRPRWWQVGRWLDWWRNTAYTTVHGTALTFRVRRADQDVCRPAKALHWLRWFRLLYFVVCIIAVVQTARYQPLGTAWPSIVAI